MQTYPLDIRHIPCTKSVPVSLSTHTLTHRQTLACDQVCVWGGSLLSLLGPHLPPALQMAMVSAPHLLPTWKLPVSFQPPPTLAAPCYKVCNYILSERCLVLKSSLALIWQWLQFRDFWHNLTGIKRVTNGETVWRGQKSNNEEQGQRTSLLWNELAASQNTHRDVLNTVNDL